MVARRKSIWFGCMLAACSSVLVLAGCGDGSESGSSRMAQPSKKSHLPTQERATLLVDQPTANPPNPTCLDLSTSQAHLFVRASAAGMYSLEQSWQPKSASRSPTPGSSSGWPTPEGLRRYTPGYSVCRRGRKVSLREQRARLIRGQATPHPRSGEGAWL